MLSVSVKVSRGSAPVILSSLPVVSIVPVAVIAPVAARVDPSKVKFDSAFKVFAVPDPVTTLLSALLLIVVWVMQLS